MYKILVLLCGLWIFGKGATAQTYVPIPVTGFTHDIFAEAGTNASAVTTTSIDATNHIMYTAAFAAANAISNGVVNTGTITSANRSYQLAPYSGNNAIYLSLNGAVANTSATSTLTLQTPAKYASVSFLSFSTEGGSTLNAILNFTDGSSANAGNFAFQDWFGGSGAIYSAFGRISRLTGPPYAVDGLPGNPRWYAADIPVSCPNQNKLLQSITINYVSQTGTSGRAVALAVSGVAFTALSITKTITPASCGASNGSVALTITGGTPPLSVLWNTIPQQFSATATGLAAGTYIATISDANGCSVNDTSVVNQTASITATATANPAVICSGDSATLTASSGPGNYTYNWSPGSLPGAVVKVSPADTTIYTVTVTDAAGCLVTATTSVFVKKKPVAAFTASPLRLCIAFRDTIRFTGTATASATFNWDFDNATIISGTGSGPYIIQFAVPGPHILKLVVTDNGCISAEASQNVIVDGASQPSFTTVPAAICGGDSVRVTFNGTSFNGASPTWNWGGGTVLSGSGLGPYTVKYASTATISLVLNNNTCSDTAAVRTVTVTQRPVALFTPDLLAGCTPLTVSFLNNSQNALTYAWDFGDNSSSTSQIPPPHNYTAGGTFNVRLIAKNGNCSDSSALQAIRVVDPPVAQFTSNPPSTASPLQLSQASFSFVNTSSNANAYKWFFGDGDSSILSNPGHRFLVPGSFTVTLYAYNSLGCFDTMSIAPYVIIPDSALRIPNVFSPNGDGINDRWQIPGLLGYPGCVVTIFDRYGQQVFNSTGYNNPWDGRKSSKDVPAGTYYYLIRTSLRTYTGWVFVIR